MARLKSQVLVASSARSRSARSGRTLFFFFLGIFLLATFFAAVRLGTGDTSEGLGDSTLYPFREGVALPPSRDMSNFSSFPTPRQQRCEFFHLFTRSTSPPGGNGSCLFFCADTRTFSFGPTFPMTKQNIHVMKQRHNCCLNLCHSRSREIRLVFCTETYPQSAISGLTNIVFLDLKCVCS